MPAQTTDISKLVTATANRLRLAQVEFADDDASVRRGYIAEQIKMALDQIVPEARPGFLAELGKRFPTGEAVAAPPPPPAEPATPAFDERILKDADFLLGSLIDLYPTLADDAKRRVIDELAQARMVKVERPVPVVQPPAAQPAAGSSVLEDELHRLLGGEPDSRLDPLQAPRVVQTLAEFACTLDQVVWNTWQQEVSPKSQIRKTAELRTRIARCMSGKAQCSEVDHNLDMLRKLTTALIAAISKVGLCARHHFEKLSPAAIDGSTEKEFLVPKEVTCWRKYQELYKEFGVTLESDMLDVIAKYAASMIKPGQPT